MQLVSGMNRGMGSQPAFVFARDCVACLLDLMRGERGTIGLRDSDYESAFANECDRNGRRLDLDATVVPAHV